MKCNHAGKIAELFARFVFRLKGYRIIAANYITGKGTRAGEVDFIAARGKTIVFVEVKQRQSLDVAAYAVLAKQQQRIWRGAEAFLKKNPKYQNYNIRFDVFLVNLPFRFSHIEDAWRF
jgi:putative endonuclease